MAVGAGDIGTLKGVGTKFYGSSEQCPTCGSVIRRMFICFFFIPVVPLKRFRVKYCTPTRYLSRRMRRSGLDGMRADQEDERRELLFLANRLEEDGYFKEAILAYREIAEKHPETSVGRDAQKSAQRLQEKCEKYRIT